MNEYEALWKQYRDLPCDITRNALVTFYLPLVAKNAARLHATLPFCVDVDDQLQAGAIGLQKAIDAYDPRRGKFETFAFTRIRGAMLDQLRAGDWISRRHRERFAREGRSIARVSIDDISPTDTRTPAPDSAAMIQSVWELANKNLNRTERLLLALRFREGLSTAEISQALGLGQSQVFNILQNVLARLSVWMAGREDELT